MFSSLTHGLFFVLPPSCARKACKRRPAPPFPPPAIERGSAAGWYLVRAGCCCSRHPGAPLSGSHQRWAHEQQRMSNRPILTAARRRGTHLQQTCHSSSSFAQPTYMFTAPATVQYTASTRPTSWITPSPPQSHCILALFLIKAFLASPFLPNTGNSPGPPWWAVEDCQLCNRATPALLASQHRIAPTQQLPVPIRCTC